MIHACKETGYTKGDTHNTCTHNTHILRKDIQKSGRK